MKANPGGQLSPNEIIGRDRLIARLWRILDRQSIVLTAERRTGKTSVLQKMAAEAPVQKLMIYRDLEDVKSTLEFAELVLQDVDEFLSRSKRTAARARQWLSHIAGIEVGGIVKLPSTIAPHWKTLLVKTIEDLSENQDRSLIFLWDELPLMLYSIKRNESENAAMEVLDTLRHLRQTHSSLRMIYTGSIGLHNVLTSLKQAGYANDPINDMLSVDVPPLLHTDAVMLGLQLIEGEGIIIDDPAHAAQFIAQSVDNIPFYIHHIIDQLTERGEATCIEDIDSIINTCIISPQDPWHLKYYRQRIDVYYNLDEKSFSLAILDILANANNPLPFSELFNQIKARIETENKEFAREVLTLLQRDHYIIRLSDGAYVFRFGLIKRFWQLERG
jgi:hypothetical protein